MLYEGVAIISNYDLISLFQDPWANRKIGN